MPTAYVLEHCSRTPFHLFLYAAANTTSIGGVSMVERIEVKSWPGLTGAFIVDMKSLADLEKIAEGLKVPFIIYRGKEYLVFWGLLGPAPICYRFKE